MGLAACALDVFADIGTRFEIEYMAYDDSMPANIISARRSVVIVAPCKPGEQLCGRDCSSVPCEALRLFYKPETSPKFIVPDSAVGSIHLPCTGTNFVAHQASLCTNASMVGSNMCVGLVGVDEYSPNLVKTEIKAVECPLFNIPADAEPSLACPPCVLSLLQAGSCAPGSYNIIYSYTYPDLDAPQPYSRVVEIHAEQSITFEQLLHVSVEINLLSDSAEYPAAKLRRALQNVLDELWSGFRQNIEDEYNSNIQRFPGQEAHQAQLAYITLSPTGQDEWTSVGNSPTVLMGAAWLHGMVSNSNASIPWLDPSTISNSVAAALLSALGSAMNASRPLRITWLELGLDDGGMLDAFETTTITTFTRVADFRSVSTGSVCPLWTDEQILQLSADVASQQVTDVLDRLRVTSQGTVKAIPILAEVDSVIRMQYLGAAWCDTVQDSTTTSQVLTLDVSGGLQGLQTDVTSSVQLALLTGSQQSDCLERLNELSLLGAGEFPSSIENQAKDTDFSVEAVAIHDLEAQVTWQLVRHSGSRRKLVHLEVPAVDQNPKHHGIISNRRNVLSSRDVYQAAFDIDNSAELYPAGLDCIQEVRQDGCASIPRVIGHDRSGTKVLGGVLIHQTRHSDVRCSKGFQEELSFRCRTLTRELGIAAQVDSCETEVTAGLPGFGSEPARNGQSSLFNPLLEIQDFYNTSNHPFEVDCRGEPRPFQSASLPGYTPGYPIVFEACADAIVALRALQYVTDSR